MPSHITNETAVMRRLNGTGLLQSLLVIKGQLALVTITNKSDKHKEEPIVMPQFLPAEIARLLVAQEMLVMPVLQALEECKEWATVDTNVNKDSKAEAKTETPPSPVQPHNHDYL